MVKNAYTHTRTHTHTHPSDSCIWWFFLVGEVIRIARSEPIHGMTVFSEVCNMYTNMDRVNGVSKTYVAFSFRLDVEHQDSTTNGHRVSECQAGRRKEAVCEAGRPLEGKQTRWAKTAVRYRPLRSQNVPDKHLRPLDLILGRSRM